jgi:Holliday junction resolvase
MKPKPQNEKSIMLEIQARLGYSGFRVLRVPPSIYSAKGWCDLIAIKNGVVLFLEIKSERGKLSIEQQGFQQLIEDAGGNYILARSWADIESFLIFIGVKGDK